MANSALLSFGGLMRHAPMMGMQSFSWRIEGAQHGVPLERFLMRMLAGGQKSQPTQTEVRAWIGDGRILLNGKPERNASTLLRAGWRVEAKIGRSREDLHQISQSGPEAQGACMIPEQIIFEDEWLIVVNKPMGIPTQPTVDQSRVNLYGLVQGFLQNRDGPGAYAGLHHRLDRDTSGVVLFTKKKEANASVTALFSGRAVQKTYQAIAVQGAADTPAEWEIRNYLGEAGRVGKATRFGAVRSGGDVAHTSFRTLERFSGAVLVEAKPHTGRTHQIRVHLAEDGHPILGDVLYGGPEQLALPSGSVARASRVMLHAAGLQFPHPMSQVPVTVDCPLPEDFSAVLRVLRPR